MADLASGIIRRFESLSGIRANHEYKWQLIADHCVGRGDFVTQRTAGERRDQYIFDNTSINSSNLLSASIDSVMTNVATRWFGLGTEDERLLEDEDVVFWLMHVEDSMYSAMMAPEANLAPQLHEMYQDLIDFGTACIFVDDVPGRGILFSARPLGEIFLAEDPYGRVDTVYRAFRYTARQAFEKWGDRSGELAKKMHETQPDTPVDYIHAVFPNKDYNPNALGSSGMKWSSVVVEKSGKKTVETGGFYDMPFITPRWRKRAGETYGYGPGEAALPEQMTLNEMRKTKLKGAQKAVDPPLLVPDDGSITQLNTQPNGVITYRQTPGGIVPQYMESRARFDIANEEYREAKQAVKEAYHYEIQNIFQDPRMTATQVVELSTRAQQLMGPMLGRIQVEALEPMLQRVYGILSRSGRLMQPPPALAEQSLNIRYISPASRAQTASDAAAIDEIMVSAISYSQVEPDVLDIVDFDEAIREKAKSKGVRGSIVRSQKDVETIRQAKAEESNRSQQNDEMLQAAEGISKITPALALAQQGNAA